MCNAAGCTFCAMISGFGAFFMFFLGICIKSGYQFVGEWYHPASEGAPTNEQTSKASGNCFAVGGIYLGFTLAAIGLTCFFERRAKRS